MTRDTLSCSLPLTHPLRFPLLLLTLSTQPPLSASETTVSVLSWVGLANMEATRTTGRGVSRWDSRTEVTGMAHTLIFLKVLPRAV